MWQAFDYRTSTTMQTAISISSRSLIWTIRIVAIDGGSRPLKPHGRAQVRITAARAREWKILGTAFAGRRGTLLREALAELGRVAARPNVRGRGKARDEALRLGGREVRSRCHAAWPRASEASCAERVGIVGSDAGRVDADAKVVRQVLRGARAEGGRGETLSIAWAMRARCRRRHRQRLMLRALGVVRARSGGADTLPNG